MKIKVTCGTFPVGEFKNLTQCRLAVKQYISDDKCCKKFYNECVREVFIKEMRIDNLTMDIFQYFDKEDRELLHPLYEFHFHYIP